MAPKSVLEVERAVRLLNEVGAGKKIIKVETTEDTIVYSGTTHSEFVSLHLSSYEDLFRVPSVSGQSSDRTQVD